MTSFTPSTLNYPQLADRAIRRVKFDHPPNTIKNFILGDEWLDTSASPTGNWWKLTTLANGGLIWVLISGSGGGGGIIVNTFLNSGTWTPNASTKMVQVWLWSGGGGGASGDISDPGTDNAGGGGGAGGLLVTQFCDIASFVGPQTITIGTGGAGGASVNLGTGLAGSPGTATSIGSIISTKTCAAMGGGQGSTNGPGLFNNKTSQTLSSINAQSWGREAGNFSTGGSGGIGGTIPQPVDPGAFAYSDLSTGGGGGGACSSVDTDANGESGGPIIDYLGVTIISGGSAGVVGINQNGGNGSSYIASSTPFKAGTGGGGGASNLSGNAGNGANGGVPGGGGGGGGAGRTGFNSGSGGNGGKGMVIIIELL